MELDLVIVTLRKTVEKDAEEEYNETHPADAMMEFDRGQLRELIKTRLVEAQAKLTLRQVDAMFTGFDAHRDYNGLFAFVRRNLEELRKASE